MVNTPTYSIEEIRTILDRVMDPEVPVLSVLDLGIVRDISVNEEKVAVTITPTYTGCPAMDVISMQIRMELMAAGVKEVEIKQVLSPAWTTDWMSDRGKRRLKEYGIAPPMPRQQVCSTTRFAAEEAIQCPHCSSYHTHRVSEFGSTACKALYQCDDCLEPFDYFKCH